VGRADDDRRSLQSAVSRRRNQHHNERRLVRQCLRLASGVSCCAVVVLLIDVVWVQSLTLPVVTMSGGVADASAGGIGELVVGNDEKVRLLFLNRFFLNRVVLIDNCRKQRMMVDWLVFVHESLVCLTSASHYVPPSSSLRYDNCLTLMFGC
jgi:hypothetical protein